jgi:hypothetical protein
MQDETAQTKNITLMLDSTIYFVAVHYKLSIPEVLAMSVDEFEQSLIWGAASKKVEAKEMEKHTKEMKGGTSIGSTDAGQPFPFE